MEKLDMNEFETQLRQMKAKLESNIARLRTEMELIATEDEIDDMQDLAALESDSMHHTAVLEQQLYELGEVDHALSKLENGGYGICEESDDEEIPIERLRAKPYARYCIEHAKQAGR